MIRERAHVLAELRELPVEVDDSQANFVWLKAEGMTGVALANALRRDGVIVAPGGPLGAEDHVRATVRDEAATDAAAGGAAARALRRAGASDLAEPT